MASRRPMEDRAIRVLPAMGWRGRLLGLASAGLMALLVASAVSAIAGLGA